MVKKIITLTAIMIFGMISLAVADTTFVDLNNWTQEGIPANGNWTVAPDGSYVTQSINGDPTYFVSDTNYINTEFKGTLEVQTTADDDFIGFVFGYNGSNDYLLLDWKQGTQSWNGGYAYEGFTLSRITDTDTTTDFWDHTGTGIEVLDTNYGDEKGWLNNTEHEFTLTYSLNRILIDIDGATIFNVAGAFDDGKFGFYNYSQANVKYEGLTGSPVPIPPTLLLLGSGFIGLIGMYRRKKV